ncbi:MAG: hypothetical protein ACI4JC_05990 [Faecalibacterium sp.]
MSLDRKIRRSGLLVLAMLTAFFPFAVPDVCARALKEGLSLCGGPLLVSLYPFLVVSPLLVQCGAGERFGVLMRPVVRLIGLRSDSAGGVLLLGLLGGFAPAASAAAESVRSGRLSAREVSDLLPACICSGPSFVILTVGGQLLGSTALGVSLYLAQILAGILSAALLRRLSMRSSPQPEETESSAEPDPSPRLDVILAQAALNYIKLCGFVLYFRMLAAGIAAFLPDRFAPFPAMLLEVCSGCDYASRTGLLASALCCAAVSLQGASALMQVRALCPAEISLCPLLLARLIHLPLSLALLCLFAPGGEAQAFLPSDAQLIPLRRVPPDCAILVFLFCCFTACELCRAWNTKNQPDPRIASKRSKCTDPKDQFHPRAAGSSISDAE